MSKPTVTLMQAEPEPVVFKVSPSDLPLLALTLLDSIGRIDEAASASACPEELSLWKAERAAVVRVLDEIGPEPLRAGTSIGLRRDVLRTKAHKRRD